ncbi:MAG: F0F1 ATP synthase subunit delta [Candidatus Wildermuthbacteria bacterium]|nr:F0F1 ATP synthase subunit delta [Candidatus Wildermuthbacteria bacterium]
MQSNVRIYAKVLHEALKGVSLVEQKKRIHVFKEILKKRGDMKISHGILQEFLSLQREEKGKIGEVVAARQLSPSLKATFSTILKSMKFVLQDRVDPAVIGGVALFLGKEFLIDNTILARLRKLSHAPYHYINNQ